MFPKPEFHPIVFEELYVREKDGQEVFSPFLEIN